MATHDIPRDGWKAYFDEFSRTRQGARVTVETVADSQSDPQIEARALPLVGITYSDKGSDADEFEIILGTKPNDHVTHTISAPKHVYHKTGAGIISDEVNADEVIEITSAGRPAITHLQFHPAGQ